MIFLCSAKELEHYQRVRRDFEGPSTPKTSNGIPAIAPTRIPGPAQVDGHVHPPVPTKRPKPPTPNDTNKTKPTMEAKGKGKATTWDSDDLDDDDDAYVTSNDFATPERKKGVSNGAFGVVGGEDDSELYC